MIKKIKNTNIFYAVTDTIGGKGVIKLVNSYEGNLLIAYVLKHDRTRLYIPDIDYIKAKRSTCKAIIRFINEYCAYAYEYNFTCDSIRYSILYEFLNLKYGFKLRFSNTRAIKNKNKSKDCLTGLDI